MLRVRKVYQKGDEEGFGVKAKSILACGCVLCLNSSLRGDLVNVNEDNIVGLSLENTVHQPAWAGFPKPTVQAVHCITVQKPKH